MKIKAVIFDMDGVLIDAKDWHYEALNQALGLFGLNISRFDHLSSFDGLPTKDKLTRLSLTHGLPAALHKLINELKQDFTMQIVANECRPNFAHEYALSLLKREGFKMAVCSNSIANTIKTMMEKSALSGYFDFFLSNEDVKNAKPNPEIYEKAIAKFELNPRECMIIEDNENGIKAATLSGANVMKIGEISEVNYENIKKHIAKFEELN